MRLKQRPQDFRVAEVFAFDEDPAGEYFVYKLKKRKLATFDAIHALSKKYGIPKADIAYAGLKDKQAESEQIVSVRGRPVVVREPGMRLEPLGRSRAPVRSANVRANRFTLVVRDLGEAECRHLPQALAEVKESGLPNYFDEQRFGSIVHGQGFIAKDLVLGRYEGALKRLIATPGRGASEADRGVEEFLSRHWGEWDFLAARLRNARHAQIVRHLQRRPEDFAGAFLKMDAQRKALHVFAYQSYIWNEGVRRFLERAAVGPGAFHLPYACGRLFFWRALAPAARERLLAMDFPLVDHRSTFAEADVAEAVRAALADEGLTLDRFRIDGVRGTFFKAEGRRLALRPAGLVASRPEPDELRRGRRKVRLEFELPRGSYATLVARRLFAVPPGRGAGFDRRA